MLSQKDQHYLEQSLWDAADIAYEYFNRPQKSYQSKEDGSPLSEADLLVNDVLIGSLEKLTVSVPIVSEENKNLPFELRKSWSSLWMIDPIDGTKEFLAGIPEFSINLALINNGRPVLGYVLDPVNRILYKGAVDSGSWKILSNGSQERIYSREQKQNRVAVASRFHGVSLDEEFCRKENIVHVEAIGSSLKIIALARGVADVYKRLGPIHEWDVAAAEAVFRYSGTRGERWALDQYNSPSLLFQEYSLGFDV